MARLEAIVARMEGGELPLETLLDAFVEGDKLAKLCESRLRDAERCVEVILNGEGGAETPETGPFTPAPTGTVAPLPNPTGSEPNRTSTEPPGSVPTPATEISLF
jgi:exodeoxyribonuclease VII small subunit